ncbi:hypothetical protein JCM17846_19480 [Iodidimonas nitroreducens]|uniref:Dienelactone hydrolase n=1 Tax=Iodidimonas nitroreducens TaxID=1236968 RepID=A0A5A7NBE1_9PROT|nr:hypothetical protein [Iodidimonas nitroreducens]GAK33163.1 putative dienelactone hydrolase [alpha proteobacterium Q-1]GER04266.1 hypothetical protein JCM17846_19480 [Iodidimonas nitroreducens]
MIRLVLLACAALVISPFAAGAFPPSDAPELAARGDYAVGYSGLTLVNPDQPDPQSGGRADRSLDLAIWYPAKALPDQKQEITYRSPTPFTPTIDPADLPAEITRQGRAILDGEPVRGEAFPLLVVSHGYQNWTSLYSWLGEAMASKGYVVVAIAHRDILPVNAMVQQLSFATTVAHRSRDQRFVITALQELAADGESPWHDLYDPQKIALLGYSMGGFGAITTAGAGYDPASLVMQSMPKDIMQGLLEDDAPPPPAGVKALVAFAPWGYQPPFSSWRPEALARITLPSLFIDGDLDDVSDYAKGVRPLWQAMTGSDRYLLSFQNARHNIAVNDAPPELKDYFQFRERLEEPVWRTDRILAINIHMITAFLDWTLKGDDAARSYLDVPTPLAQDGVWPIGQGEQVGAALADEAGASAGYWRGFHRRWAVGLQLEHLLPSADGAANVTGD